MQKLIKNVILGILLLAIFVITNAEALVPSTMMIRNGMVVPCPHMMHAMSLCNMTPMEQIGDWQHLFLSTAQYGNIITFLLLLSIAIIWSTLMHLTFSTYNNNAQLYYKQHRKKVPNMVQVALGKGRIHSKAF